MRTVKLILVMMIGAAITACGLKSEASPVTEAETTMETVRRVRTIPSEKAENCTESETEEEQEALYEDNFAVDTSAAAAFAGRIKAAVAAKDIEALADLTAFPVYVENAGGGVETREAFLALGEEKIFIPELLESVEDADTSNLSPSMAGFSISKDGKANIIFGVVDGRLAITGINGTAGTGKLYNEAKEAVDLKSIAELLGKPDLQTAALFGGGNENWTEDKSFYIGRIYRVNLFDNEVTIYTSCDEKQVVNAVSVWLVNGERKVTEKDAVQWVERLNEFTGREPDIHDAVSEGGSKNWNWFTGQQAVSLNWLDDMLTISMNVVKGELE